MLLDQHQSNAQRPFEVAGSNPSQESFNLEQTQARNTERVPKSKLLDDVQDQPLGSRKMATGSKMFNMVDSHSIACGDDRNIDDVSMSSTATDARDMVKDLNYKRMVQNSFGCNTETTTTSEKHIDAICATNEIGSQAKVGFKEVMCSTKINTETQACQKDTIGTEKEVSCLILGPADFNEKLELNDDLPDCFRCDGSKVNKKGLPCKKCNATGKLQTKFFKDLHNILQVEVGKYCT